MNADIIGGMSRAEGYLIALANIAADREICGDNRKSFLVVTANQMSLEIRQAINYITELENEIGKMKVVMIHEQTPVAPTEMDVTPARTKYGCGNCHYPVGFESVIQGGEKYRHAYCPWCGKKVKWDA